MTDGDPENAAAALRRIQAQLLWAHGARVRRASARHLLLELVTLAAGAGSVEIETAHLAGLARMPDGLAEKALQHLETAGHIQRVRAAQGRQFIWLGPAPREPRTGSENAYERPGRA